MMEISVGDYGRMIFEMSIGERDRKNLPDHWKAIVDEAEPLVRKLLALNDKMAAVSHDGGYKIHGYIDKKGKKSKKILSDFERIRQAVVKSWEVKTDTLKEGDTVFLHKDYDIPAENYPYDGATTVNMINKGRFFVDHPLDRHGVYEIRDEEVLKAPADYDDNNEYQSQEYWLAKATELGI